MDKIKRRCFIEKLSLKRLLTFAVMLCMLFSAVLMPVAYASEYDVSVQSEEQVVADGVYYLKKGGSYLASSLTMQTTKQTSVPNSLTQMWKLYHVGNGHYTIRPMDDLGKCLNGQGMTLQFYDDPVDGIDELSAHSRWVITETTSGYQIKIYTYQWTLYEYGVGISGAWELERVTAPPSGVLLKSTQAWIAPKSTVTFKAAVYSGSTIDQSVTWSSSNTNVAKVDSTGVVTGVSQGTATITAKSTYNTSWQKSFTANVSFVPNGTYYMKNKASGKVVDIYNSNTNAGESIHQLDFEGTNDQQWIFELQQDGYYTIKSVYSNLYLSVKENSSASGAEVVQNSGGNADGQRWSVTTTESGAYKLKAKCAGTQDLCLMKGTYIFYLNKLVHMAYTNNTTYDDEWLLVRKRDYTLMYIGADSNDPKMPPIVSAVTQALKDNAYMVGSAYTSLTTDALLGSLSECAIFSCITHGTQTFIVTTNGTLTVSAINGLSDNALDNLEFVYLGACSAGQGGTGANNVVNALHSKGADTVLGFKDDIFIVQANLWTKVFMETLSTGCTIEYAMNVADVAVSDDDECKRCSHFSTSSEYRYLVGSSLLQPCA